jgi:fluoride exporter
MKNMFLVFLGGGLGSALRHATVLLMSRWTGKTAFPWSIFVANMLGSFILGCILAVPALRGKDSPLWFFLATGVLGGYTTFSTLSNDSLALWQGGHVMLALLNSVGGAVLGVLCAAAGWQFAKSLA